MDKGSLILKCTITGAYNKSVAYDNVGTLTHCPFSKPYLVACFQKHRCHFINNIITGQNPYFILKILRYTDFTTCLIIFHLGQL